MSGDPRGGALREPGFRLFFTGYATSLFGTMMAPVAVTFAVLGQGGSASTVGYVLAVGAAALVGLLLVGGVVADRVGRRRAMVAADVLRAGAHGGLAGWLLAGHPPLWAFLVAEALIGAGDAFFGPAMTGLIPQLVAGPGLQQANAFTGVARSTGETFGPAVAGTLVAVASPAAALLIDAATYVVSAVTLLRLPGLPAAAARPRAFVADLREGWRDFRGRQWLVAVVSEFSLFHLLVWAPFMVLGAVIARAHLGGAGTWGAILAVEGAGSVAGGLAMLRWRPHRPLLVGSLAMLGWAFPPLLLALHAAAAVVAAGALLAGVAFGVFGPLWETTMQREIPPALLSRVSSYDWFGSVAMLPVGLAVVGPLSAALGVRGTLFLASASMVALTVAVVAVPDVRRVSHRDPPGADPPPAQPQPQPGSG